MKTIYLIIAVAVGCVIPFLAHSLQFYFALIAVVIALALMITRKGDISSQDLLVLFIALIPFQHFRLGTETAYVRLTELAFFPLFILWISQSLLKTPPHRKKLPVEFMIMALFIAVSCLSITKSLLPAISIFRTAVLTYIVVFSFIVADILDTESKIKRIVTTLVIVASLASVWGILQSVYPKLSLFYITPYSDTKIGPVTLFRATCGWDNPNYFALFLSIVLPITAVMALSGKFVRSGFFKLCLLLQLFGMISSYSRTGAISTLAASFFLLWHFRRKKLVIVSLITVIAIIGLVWLSKEFLQEKLNFIYVFFLRAPITKIGKHPESVLIFRWDAWQANIRMFLDNPFLGVGPFMAGENFMQYRPAGSLYPLVKLEPHNEYLSHLSERGIFAFLVYLSFLWTVIARGLRGFRQSHETELGCLLLGLTGGVVSFAVAGMGEAVLTDVTFWVVAGLLIATSRLIQNQSGTPNA